ncbi:Ureidoglycolate lyase [Methylobacterium crusticola]|uniref:Ureidoglycolate lyase n=1 Tax=Methylobacterium crusticola TaxID=1697972 RepID=A0ABQ4RAX4_9HYPH|nr:ureidoglycolate lyase [Methylobacterium crusticola]GJD54025.1 Ureidoglycolate lyase [Methylobacterium crusticola]
MIQPMPNTITQLRLRPVSRDAFAPFGTLVEMNRPTTAVNEGTALRHDVHAFAAADARAGFRLVTSIYDAEARDLRALRILERHANSPQLIMPLGGGDHAVIVCLSRSNGGPDFETLTAFRCASRQGVIYRPGLWHHPIAALGRAAQFLVQSWQEGSDADCEIVTVTARGILVDAA